MQNIYFQGSNGDTLLRGPGSSAGKESACNAGKPGSIPGREHPLEKGMATHSSILAWKIPWTEELGRLQSMGSQRVRHDWAANTFTFHFFHAIVCSIKNKNILSTIHISLNIAINSKNIFHEAHFSMYFDSWDYHLQSGYFDNSTTLWYLCVDLWLTDWIFFSPKEFLMTSLKTVK